MATTTNKTKSVAADATIPALSAKQLKAQEAKSKKFFAQQEAAKALTTPAPTAPTELVHPEVIKAGPFDALQQVAKETTFEEQLELLKKQFNVTADLKVEKSKTAKVQQNDITRPAAGTLCGLIWATCDELTATHGSPAQIAQLKASESVKQVNDHTVKTQYARWRKFNGIVGHKSTKPAPVQGSDAGLEAAFGIAK
jgi:hypothetical protein